MAALTQLGVRSRGALETLLVLHAQLLFSRNRWVGLCVLVAVCSIPRYALLSGVALLGASLAARGLGIGNGALYTPYGYSSLWVGYGIAHAYALDAASAGFALACGGLCALTSAALTALVSYLGWVPVLSLPYMLTAWFALGVAPQLPLRGAPPLEAASAWLFAAPSAEVAAALPAPALRMLEGFGTCVLLPSAAAGALIMLALLVHSRIAALLAVGAGLCVLSLLELTHVPVSESLAQLSVCNAALAAMALGGVWLVPSRASFVLALLSAVLATFFALGFAQPLQRLGLSLGFLPWNCAVLFMLAALNQRLAPKKSLRLATFAAPSPEQLLLGQVHELLLPGEPSVVPVHLPFASVWSCTQAVDGAFTHQGVLRHAYDFEVYGEHDGSLCAGAGEAITDYRCYGLPVLAAADGTVVATETMLPNNEVGEVSLDKPWGNHVTIQHAPTLFSVVAHLSPGSIVVWPGQFVRRGALLGYLGNSGRSPRPHLHFQLQSELRLGSATLPCRFTDVVVRTGHDTRLEAAHVPLEGEALRSLEPNYALAAYFEWKPGASFTYRIDERTEQLHSAYDAWGRPVLRSSEHGSELLLLRSDSGFACGPLEGSERSVLAWLRLCALRVPYDREAQLRFRNAVPQRWLGGFLRRMRWDVTSPLVRRPALELDGWLELDGERLVVRGVSRQRDARGVPLLETRAVLLRGVGPSLIELAIAGRRQRAELVSEGAGRLRRSPNVQATPRPALGLGDWS